MGSAKKLAAVARSAATSAAAGAAKRSKTYPCSCSKETNSAIAALSPDSSAENEMAALSDVVDIISR